MGRLVPPFPSCIPSLLLRPGAPDLSPAGPGFDEAPPQGVRRTLPLLIRPSIIKSGRCLHNEGLPLFTELPRRVVFSETCIHTPAHLYGTGGMRAELRLFSELPIRVLLGNSVNRVGGGRIGGVQPPTLEGARRGLGTGDALTRP